MTSMGLLSQIKYSTCHCICSTTATLINNNSVGDDTNTIYGGALCGLTIEDCNAYQSVPFYNATYQDYYQAKCVFNTICSAPGTTEGSCNPCPDDYVYYNVYNSFDSFQGGKIIN